MQTLVRAATRTEEVHFLLSDTLPQAGVPYFRLEPRLPMKTAIDETSIEKLRELQARIVRDRRIAAHCTRGSMLCMARDHARLACLVQRALRVHSVRTVACHRRSGGSMPSTGTGQPILSSWQGCCGSSRRRVQSRPKARWSIASERPLCIRQCRRVIGRC